MYTLYCIYIQYSSTYITELNETLQLLVNTEYIIQTTINGQIQSSIFIKNIEYKIVRATKLIEQFTSQTLLHTAHYK